MRSDEEWEGEMAAGRRRSQSRPSSWRPSDRLVYVPALASPHNRHHPRRKSKAMCSSFPVSPQPPDQKTDPPIECGVPRRLNLITRNQLVHPAGDRRPGQAHPASRTRQANLLASPPPTLAERTCSHPVGSPRSLALTDPINVAANTSQPGFPARLQSR